MVTDAAPEGNVVPISPSSYTDILLDPGDASETPAATEPVAADDATPAEPETAEGESTPEAEAEAEPTPAAEEAPSLDPPEAESTTETEQEPTEAAEEATEAVVEEGGGAAGIVEVVEHLQEANAPAEEIAEAPR